MEGLNKVLARQEDLLVVTPEDNVGNVFKAVSGNSVITSFYAVRAKDVFPTQEAFPAEKAAPYTYEQVDSLWAVYVRKGEQK